LVETTPQQLGASRLQLRQVVMGTAGDIRATLDVEGAFVSQNKPIRVPADVRERLREHMPSRSTGLQDQQ
jgi:acyl-CoA thioesterase FadM